MSRGARTAASGRRSPAASSASRAPDSSLTSAFAGESHGVDVRAATALTAAPKPRFSSKARSRTQGNSSATIPAEPSVEALSATQTSARPASASACKDRRQARNRSRVFQETTATATGAGVESGWLWAPADEVANGFAEKRPLEQDRGADGRRDVEREHHNRRENRLLDAVRRTETENESSGDNGRREGSNEVRQQADALEEAHHDHGALKQGHDRPDDERVADPDRAEGVHQRDH